MKKRIFGIVCMMFLVVIGAVAKGDNKGKHTFIHPMSSGLNLKKLTDATVTAAFYTKDFDWNKNTLTMTIYTEQLYDAVDVSKLKVGDGIFYQGKAVIVRQLNDKGGNIQINGGYDKKGITLSSNEGGTYRSVQADNNDVYVEVGKVTLPFGNKLTITDCKEDSRSSQYTIDTDQKKYIVKLRGSRCSFSYLDTTVEIRRGVITNITRHSIR